MQPINDRVVLSAWKHEEATTPAGIVIPGMDSRGQHAEVVAVGPGNRTGVAGVRMELSVKQGDVVIIPPKTGIPILIEGMHFTVVREDDILVNLGRKGEES